MGTVEQRPEVSGRPCGHLEEGSLQIPERRTRMGRVVEGTLRPTRAMRKEGGGTGRAHRGQPIQ